MCESALRIASRYKGGITEVYKNQQRPISAVPLNIVQFAITNRECTKL
jgi:hypothetical protein